MQDFLADPWKCFYAGVGLTALLLLAFFGFSGIFDSEFLLVASRWIHVVSAIIWIGMVWFVNFVMLPANYAMSDEERPVLLKYIAPGVAPWFLHTSTLTLVFGLFLAMQTGAFMDVMTMGAWEGFAVPKSIMLGIGVWIGIIMWAFTWFLIWPNMKVVLGRVSGDKEAKMAARRKMRNFARKNLILTIPVTFAMVAGAHGF